VRPFSFRLNSHERLLNWTLAHSSRQINEGAAYYLRLSRRAFILLRRYLDVDFYYRCLRNCYRRNRGGLACAGRAKTKYSYSFKTRDNYGNLQLTFFSNVAEWVADIDIDDTAGLEHIFQVVRNKLSGQPTHPYNIHEILVGYQHIDPGYSFEI
jgi:hypothetical protein